MNHAVNVDVSVQEFAHDESVRIGDPWHPGGTGDLPTLYTHWRKKRDLSHGCGSKIRESRFGNGWPDTGLP